MKYISVLTGESVKVIERFTDDMGYERVRYEDKDGDINIMCAETFKHYYKREPDMEDILSWE